MVPTYASLMIHYRPDKISFEQLKEEVMKRTCGMEQVEDAKRSSKKFQSATKGNWEWIWKNVQRLKISRQKM